MPWIKPYTSPRNTRLEIEHYQKPEYITFITIRAYSHQQPFVHVPINQMVIQTLRLEQEEQNCSIFTYCLMPDHLHFLVAPNQDGISVLTFTDRLKGKITNKSWQLGWKGKIWQPRYFDHIIRTNEDLRKIAEYIINNPVRKGLVRTQDEWQWAGHFCPLPL